MKTCLKIFALTGSMMICSGCALLQIPGQLIGGTFSILGKLIEFASKMPMPPPGVF